MYSTRMKTDPTANASRGRRATSQSEAPTMKGTRPSELATASATVRNDIEVPLRRTPHHIVSVIVPAATPTAASPLATTLASQAARRGPVANATSSRPLTSSLAVEAIHDTTMKVKATDMSTAAIATNP